MTLWLFLHLLGSALWLGGGGAIMFVGIASRGESRALLGHTARVQWTITRTVLAPGVLATILSGLMLTFRLMGAVGMGNAGLVTMQGLGLLAGLLTLFVTIPAYARLARLDPEGQHAAYVDRLRARARLVGAVSGIMGVLAMGGAAVYRYGA